MCLGKWKQQPSVAMEGEGLGLTICITEVHGKHRLGQMQRRKISAFVNIGHPKGHFAQRGTTASQREWQDSVSLRKDQVGHVYQNELREGCN